MNPATFPLFRLFLCSAIIVIASHGAETSETYPKATEGIRVIENEPIPFPRKLYQWGIISGWAKVVVAIDENGQLMDALIIGYSHPEFEQTTLDALHQWSFKPASIQGKPVTSVTQLNISYSHLIPQAKIVFFDSIEYLRHRGGFGSRDENKLFPLDELDRIPTPFHIISPAYSDENARQHAGKKAVVDFYIDATGQVRLPTLHSADDPDLARQALAAVVQWRFEPPRRRGKAVITKARQEFVFTSSAKPPDQPPEP